MSNITNIYTIAKAAVSASKASSPFFPAQLIVSQFGIESAWGKRVIGQNNYFGMTFVPERHKLSVWSPTVEYYTSEQINKLLENREENASKIRYISSSIVAEPTDKNYGKWRVNCERIFADFPTLREAMEDVVKLISGAYHPNKSIYKDCWRGFRDGKLTWREFGLCYGKIYATGGGYGDLLIKIAQQNNVKEALRAANYTYK